MKVRMGLGLGVGQVLDDAGRLAEVVDLLEDLGFDSLWMSDRTTGKGLDPLAALAFAAGRTERLKLGTNVLIVPGRDPFLMARQLAAVDRLSGGRLLPGVGLGSPTPADRPPFRVPTGTRATAFEEGLEIMRRLWTDGTVEHPEGGQPFRIDPRPTRPLEVWFGGRKPKALERAGRLSDGWIGSFQTPASCGAARRAIEEAASAAGRSIDADHYGTTVFYARERRTELGELIVSALSEEEYVPEVLLPCGADELTAVIAAYVAEGLTKFVLVPADAPDDWRTELTWLREVIAPLES